MSRSEKDECGSDSARVFRMMITVSECWNDGHFTANCQPLSEWFLFRSGFLERTNGILNRIALTVWHFGNPSVVLPALVIV